MTTSDRTNKIKHTYMRSCFMQNRFNQYYDFMWWSIVFGFIKMLHMYTTYVRTSGVTRTFWVIDKLRLYRKKAMGNMSKFSIGCAKMFLVKQNTDKVDKRKTNRISFIQKCMIFRHRGLKGVFLLFSISMVIIFTFQI